MISVEDKSFLDKLFSEELTADRMEILDEKLRDEEFKMEYKRRLNENYQYNRLDLFIKYLPMIILVILIFTGIYLIQYING